MNGAPPSRDFKRQTGYVTQDDCLMGNLTVRETFRFHAAMKMASSTTPEEREQRIQDILDELGLAKAADQYVGTQFRRGVSGGEKKRVSIGVELLTDPGLLFLDEPTSGLDAYNSLSVMKTLRRLAERGRTIICTIHQPRSSIYDLFDQLMILSHGRTVYYGGEDAVLPFFSSLGYVCPQYSNPADFLIDTVVRNEKAAHSALRVANPLDHAIDVNHQAKYRSIPESNNNNNNLEEDDVDDEDLVDGDLSAASKLPTTPSGPVIVLADQFASSQQCLALLEQVSMEERSGKLAPVMPTRSNKFPTSWFTQFGWLVWRTTCNFYRNPMVTYIQFFQTIFFAVLVGLIYLQMADTVTALQDRLGAIFFIMTNQCFGNMGALNNFLEERNIYQREQQAGLYYTSAYFLAKTTIEGPSVLLFPIIFGSIAYWMIGLTPIAQTFMIFLGGLLTFAAVATSLFLFIGSLAPSPIVAQILSPLIIVLMLLFGGFYVNNDNVPVYFEWLKYWSIFYWGFGILVWNELHNFNEGKGFQGVCNCSFSSSCACCNDANATLVPNSTNCQYYITGEEELRLLGLQNTEIWQNFAILLGMIAGYRILCYLALRFLYKEKR